MEKLKKLMEWIRLQTQKIEMSNLCLVAFFSLICLSSVLVYKNYELSRSVRILSDRVEMSEIKITNLEFRQDVTSDNLQKYKSEIDDNEKILFLSVLRIENDVKSNSEKIDSIMGVMGKINKKVYAEAVAAVEKEKKEANAIPPGRLGGVPPKTNFWSKLLPWNWFSFGSSDVTNEKEKPVTIQKTSIWKKILPWNWFKSSKSNIV